MRTIRSNVSWLGLLLFGVILLLSVSDVSNAARYPYPSYTYDFWGKPVSAPQAYLPAYVITGDSLGVGALTEPQGLHVEGDRIYIVDTNNNRIIVTDTEWNVEQVIKQFVDEEGRVQTFNRPEGVFVTPKTYEIYIADTNNARIVHLDQYGELIRIIGPPETEVEGVLEEHFTYRPRKLVVSPLNKIYVLSRGSSDGFLEFDPSGNFRGFMGAPPVTPSLRDILWRRFATDEQLDQMRLWLPASYNNVALDHESFIMAIEANQLKKLNPSGTDIMNQTGHVPVQGDVGRYNSDGTAYSATFVDLATRQNGITSVLDRNSGRVFTYDNVGNLLYVFGGLGNVFGTFQDPVAVKAVGDNLIVMDRRQGRITVFEPTRYAQLIHAAINEYEAGHWDEATELWREVLKLNSNFDLAYTGIGMNLYNTEQYYEAMHNFKLANNRARYSDALRYYRIEVVGENFGLIATSIIAIVLAIYLTVKYELIKKLKRRLGFRVQEKGQLAAAYYEEDMGFFRKNYDALKYALHVVFHPFDGFWDLKHEKRGTVPAATTILILVCLTYVFIRQYTGFAFNERDLSKLNILVEFISIIGPFVLWVIVNWGLTTLMGGKGTMKDVYIATAYALTPLIIINVPLTIASNFMTLDEFSFYGVLLAIAVFWTGALIILGTMVIHDYDMGKTLLASLLILVGIGTILFVGLLFFNLVDLLLGFVTEVYAEIFYRI